MNNNIFRRLSAVSSLSPVLLKELVEVTGTPFEVGAGEVLLMEGEQDDALMIIVEGELEVIVGTPPVVIARVGPGAMLGEMAIFGLQRKRRASVRTITPTVGVIFQREGIERLRQRGHAAVTRLEGQAVHAASARLRAMNERISELAQGTDLEPVPPEGLLARLRSWLGQGRAPTPEPPDPQEVLMRSRVFGSLPGSLITQLAQELRLISVEQGDIIMEQDSFGTDAYVVAAGKVGVYRAVRSEGNERVAVLEVGEVFGLVGLVHGAARTATCIAEEPSWVLHLPESVYLTFTTPTASTAPLLHRAIYEAQADQLDRANRHVARLVVGLTGSTAESGERASYQEVITQTV